MQQIRLGRTEVQVAAIGFGTWPLGGPNVANGQPVGWSGADDAESEAALLRGHALGLRHWDTADVYGDGRSEQVIGRMWDRVPRADIFLATKVGWDPGEYDHPYHHELVRRRIERSLVNLRTDVIDLYYLHHCDFGPGDRYLDGALAEIVRARDAGKIRFIGLSDWDNDKVSRLADPVDPDVVQVYRNVIDDTYESSGLKSWVEAHDIGVAFFSPLMHGLLLGKYEHTQVFPDGDFRNQVEGFRDARLVAGLRQVRGEVQQRFGRFAEPMLEVLIGAVLADCDSACALQGLRNPDQVERAANYRGGLAADDIAWIRERYQSLVRVDTP